MIESGAAPVVGPYQTFWRRVVAGIIDGLVLLPVALLTAPDIYPISNGALIVGLNVVGYSIPVAYSVILHARYGQTLGKRARSVRVLDVSESRLPTWRQAVLRDIGEILFNAAAIVLVVAAVLGGAYSAGDEYLSPTWDVLAWAGLGWGVLEIVTMLTNPKRRALHDYIAGTVVVRVQ